MTRKTFTATVEATVENAPEGYGNADFADDIRDTTHLAITEDTPLEVVVMQVSGAPEQQKVWVATISDDNDSPGPAVYVAPYLSDTADNLMGIIRKQQGVPDDEDVLDWMDLRGKTAVWDTYYVETGDK